MCAVPRLRAWVLAVVALGTTQCATRNDPSIVYPDDWGTARSSSSDTAASRRAKPAPASRNTYRIVYPKGSSREAVDGEVHSSTAERQAEADRRHREARAAREARDAEKEEKGENDESEESSGGSDVAKAVVGAAVVGAALACILTKSCRKALGRSGGGGYVDACCKHCDWGKACGDSCINRYYSCYQPPGCACDQ